MKNKIGFIDPDSGYEVNPDVVWDYYQKKRREEIYTRYSPLTYHRAGYTFTIPATPLCLRLDGGIRASVKNLLKSFYLQPHNQKQILIKLAAKGIILKGEC